MTLWNGTIVECCVFYADFVYAEFRIFALYAECHNAECHHTGCRYDEFRILALCAECHHTECRYAKSCGAVKKLGIMRSRIYYFTEKYLACLSSY
jgi:hypothetical protein